MNAFGNIRRDHKVRLGPYGVHIFNRRTGLNVLVDEVCVPGEFWARAPRQVSIALTNACDLSCSYCYAPKNHAELDFNKLTGWLTELDTNGCLGIGFGGGEPTLYRYFPDICRYVAGKTGMAVTFTTHAHRVNADLAEKLQGVVHFIRVSMDGVGTTYQALRGRPFSALCSHLEVIRLLAPFGINFVVNKSTLLDLGRAVDFASEIGAQEFLLLPEQQVHGVGGIDTTTARALHDWVNTYQGPVPLAISEAGAGDGPPYIKVTNEEGYRAYAHIDATGVLRQSSYDRGGVLIGPKGFMEALHEASYPEECQ